MKASLTTAYSLAAAAAGALLCACAIASAALHWAETPLPFSLDVALVYFLASLPLATSLAVAALAQLPRRGSTLAVFGLEAIVLVLIPRLYIHARCQNDLNQAAQLAGQFRYAEASALLHRVVALEPHATWNGNSASQAANSIDQIVRQVEAQIASPLTENATNADRLSRATNLAVLGRTTEALALLDSSDSLANSPEAHNLRGTIHESRNRWQLARDWYARAKAAWQTLPDSPDRTAGLKQAITGTAFCERKLGHLHAAEAAWHDLLEISPTADTHFLLAQFYEDTQQAAKCRLHSRQAMLLDPNRYAQQADRLMDKLITSHFGCLGVFSAENSPSTPFGAATIGNK